MNKTHFVGDEFYTGDSKCYFLEDICDSGNKSEKLTPTKVLFTTSRDVLERYYFTGQCGFDDVYIRSKNSVLKLPVNNLIIPSVSNPKLDLGIYRHFKGGEYLILGVAFDLDKKYASVAYESLCLNGTVFDREYNNFLENTVSKEFNYSGPRFTFISKE